MKKQQKNAFLSFKLGKELFAISVHKVLEVLQRQEITEVPNTPEFIRGVINFRGEILPVTETRKKFNMPDRGADEKYVIIVLELKMNNETLNLGATADGVKDVVYISDEEIKEVPEMGSNYNTEFITGMIKKNDKFIMLLDIEKVFSVQEVNLITETVNEKEILE